MFEVGQRVQVTSRQKGWINGFIGKRGVVDTIDGDVRWVTLDGTTRSLVFHIDELTTLEENRPPMVHHLKTWVDHYTDVVSGRKTFEVRRDDRDYRVTDTLELREYDKDTQVYTGRSSCYTVTYILRDPVFGKEGYCIMGIRPIEEGA